MLALLHFSPKRAAPHLQERYKSMGELRDDIHKLPASSCSRRKTLLSLAAFGLFLIATWFIYMLRVDDKYLSKEQFKICRVDEFFVLRDCGSKNGTSVNGELVESRVLVNGDQITAGQTTLLYIETFS